MFVQASVTNTITCASKAFRYTAVLSLEVAMVDVLLVVVGFSTARCSNVISGLYNWP